MWVSRDVVARLVELFWDGTGWSLWSLESLRLETGGVEEVSSYIYQESLRTSGLNVPT